jgi:hypothetical protein
MFKGMKIDFGHLMMFKIDVSNPKVIELDSMLDWIQSLPFMVNEIHLAHP